MIQWRHAWGEKVEVGNVCRQLQVVDGVKPLGILIDKNVGSYGGSGF